MALLSVLGGPELAFAIGHLAGHPAAKECAAAAKSINQGLQETLPRIAALQPSRVVVVGGTSCNFSNEEGQGRALGTVETFDAASGQWFTWPSMPTPRSDCAVAVLGGCLYVVGGSGADHEARADVERFDTCSRVWSVLAPLPTARRGCAAVAMGSFLYVVGGSDNAHAALSVVEKFDARSGTWSTSLPMPTARAHCTAAVANHYVYVFGGTRCRLSGVMFDPKIQRWTALPNMSVPRSSCGVASLDSGLYIIGNEGVEDETGPFPLGDVEVFDHSQKEKGAWKTSVPVPTTRGGCAVTASQRHIYVIGGWDLWHCSNVNERFDPALGKWDSLPRMPTRRCQCAAVHLRVSAEVDGPAIAAGESDELLWQDIVDWDHWEWIEEGDWAEAAAQITPAAGRAEAAAPTTPAAGATTATQAMPAAAATHVAPAAEVTQAAVEVVAEATRALSEA